MKTFQIYHLCVVDSNKCLVGWSVWYNYMAYFQFDMAMCKYFMVSNGYSYVNGYFFPNCGGSMYLYLSCCILSIIYKKYNVDVYLLRSWYINGEKKITSANPTKKRHIDKNMQRTKVSLTSSFCKNDILSQSNSRKKNLTISELFQKSHHLLVN